ncbi:anti-sigma factor [Beijerinckia sp. L45]|uniref:anti-sigma factor family protein n=1 Tax=Beijerinckia sp. L45 TaxID=1641855 RepID=UPI00131E5940|nr:anti-sigma factor [Beijerinckia sp. L45]
MTDPHAPIGEDDLQGFIDDRLDAERRPLVEAYVADHPEVARRLAADRAIRDGLRGALQSKVEEPVPARLRIANIRTLRRTLWIRRGRVAAAAAVVFLVGAGSAFLADRVVPGLSRPAAASAATMVARDATAAYRTFVVDVAHPVEVGGENEGLLIQWLSTRLGLPLAAPDLSTFGYTLMGGRVLPGFTRPAAQLMYENARGKRVTVFIRPSKGGGEGSLRFQQDGETASFIWMGDNFGCAITGAIGRDELRPIAEAVYRRLDDDHDDDRPRKG